ncbi:MAG: MFS transporter [Rhodospirillales bacterium]|nr:MFS transporter [Rhodospirillales bacterium]
MLNLGLGLQSTLLGVRAVIENFPVTETGMIMSSYYAGFTLGSIAGPALVNRVGHIQTFAALASMLSASTLMHGIFLEPASWLLLRFITGICWGGLCLVGESWLNARATNQNRGAILSIYMIVGLGASAGAQLLLNLTPPSGIELFVLVSIITSLSLVPVALSKSTGPARVNPVRMKISQLYKNSPLGVAGSFSSGVVNGALWSMSSVFAINMGFSTAEVSLFMTAIIIGGTVIQWPLGWLSDRIDRRKLIAALCVAALGICAVFVFGTLKQGFWIYLFGALFGGMTLTLYPLSIAHTNDYLEPDQFISASSAMLLLFGAGAISGPVLASLFMFAIGPEGMFVFIGTINILMIAFAFFRMTQRVAMPVEDQVDFVPGTPRSSPILFEMDPRR